MKRIIVIDDDPATLDVIKLLFEIEGFCVLGLVDFKTLYQTIDEFEPTIILMDVIMGMVDGRDICKDFKLSAYKHIPVILMSVVDGFHEDTRKPLYSEDFIEKPFPLDVMLDKVDKLIRGTSSIRV